MAWFDATQIDPATGSAQFPIGTHPVVIRASSKVAVKDKPNEGRLVLHCEIIDGPSKGAKGDYGLNLWNANDQSREIAAKQLSAVCHVIGWYQLNDQANMCSELFNKPFVIIVTQQADPKYTQVSGVMDMAGNAPVKRDGQPAAPVQPPQAQQPPAQPGWPANAQPQQQPPQTGPAPGWQGQPQQPQQAAQQPAPSWGSPPATQQPAQQPAPGWQQQPPGSGQPSWAK